MNIMSFKIPWTVIKKEYSLSRATASISKSKNDNFIKGTTDNYISIEIFESVKNIRLIKTGVSIH